MIKFRTRIQAELYLKWINWWYPIKFKRKGDRLLSNSSFVTQNSFCGIGIKDDNRWVVFKQFITQEHINDLKNTKGFDPDEFDELIINEDRKRKLDFILDDKPLEPTLAENIAKNIIKEIDNYKMNQNEKS